LSAFNWRPFCRRYAILALRNPELHARNDDDVLQEPEANCGGAVSEPIDGRRGVGAVHADEELRVIGELVVMV